ncbi:MAG: hypothetical protein LLG13_10525 [Bacteroidales bacterium]|nr:hypothetical protein [Bacteroidales bacterium]
MLSKNSTKSKKNSDKVYHEEKNDTIERKKFEGIEKPRSQRFSIERLPFEIETNQVFYIENSFNPITHSYFSKNIEKVNDVLNHYRKSYQKKYEVVFLPKILESWTTNLTDFKTVADYNIPNICYDELKTHLLEINQIPLLSLSNEILRSLNFNGEKYNGFLRARNDDSEGYTHIEFRYFEINPQTEEELEKQLWYYAYHLEDRMADMHFMKMSERDLERMGLVDESADFKFHYEAHKIAEDIKQKIETLRQTGFYHLILNVISNELSDTERNSLNKFETINLNPKLSHLLITNDYEIILTDYRKEIKITPLQKAVYFLFLRHPEGIVFKYIYDYRDELLEIYKNLMYFDGWENAIDSIKNLTDPTNNSINEKCSRIKEAFVSCCDDNIAKYYYITGHRGNLKKIMLDSNFIKIENEILLTKTSKIPLTKSKSKAEIESLEEKLRKLYDECKKMFSQKEYINAINGFTEIILLSPFHYNAYFYRAICHSNIGNYLEAEQDNNHAIDLNKKDSPSYHNRGEARLMLKKYTEAIDDFNYYIDNIEDSSDDSYFLRGIAKMELDLLESACQDWYIAKELGHDEANKYLQKYPNIKFKKIKIPEKGKK